MITNKYQRKYASTQNGKIALSKASRTYQTHNLDKATNYNQRYSKDDYQVLYNVMIHILTPHEGAIILGRNTRAINNKVARIRKELSNIKPIILLSTQKELVNQLSIANFKVGDEWLINDGQIVGYNHDTTKRLY